jgi:hypothetical protein
MQPSRTPAKECDGCVDGLQADGETPCPCQDAPPEHFDDHAVRQFGKMMAEKMAASRAKGRSGWDDPSRCSVEYLRELLHDHLAKGDPVDVANICMMLRHYDASTAPTQPSPEDVDDLDARMKAAGMIPLSEMLNSHGPMEKWMRHAQVHTLAEFIEWVSMKQREYMTMRMRYELGDKDKNDGLYEWVFAHAAVFDGIATQLRAIAGEGQ